MAGFLTVWHDPEDGKVYVVNGHRRLEMARRAGVKSIQVRMLDPKYVPDSYSALLWNAIQTIAEGGGTAALAAQFLRGTGIVLEELERRGVSLRGKIAKDGATLARLDDRVLNRVATGRMKESLGLAIGKEVPDPYQQRELLKLIDGSKRPVTNKIVKEIGLWIRAGANPLPIDENPQDSNPEPIPESWSRWRKLSEEEKDCLCQCLRNCPPDSLAPGNMLLPWMDEEGRIQSMPPSPPRKAESPEQRKKRFVEQGQESWDRVAQAFKDDPNLEVPY